MLALLADLTGATDPKLRELAKRLAGRLFLEVSHRGPTRPRGIGKMALRPYRPDAGDLDLDASMDEIVGARAERRATDADALRVRGWVRPSTAISLLVDRSGSMGGKPLATSAMAAAAVAWRSPADYSVIAFAVVLSDCRATVEGDVEAAARALDEVVILAPVGDDVEARALASRVGARVTVIDGPSDVPAALRTVLD